MFFRKISILTAGAAILFVVNGCAEKKIVVKKEKPKVVKVAKAEEYYNQAVEALAENNTDRALARFGEAIKRSKRSTADLVDAHYNIGVIMLQRGEYDKASEEFNMVLEKQPNHRDALLNLGVILKEKKKYMAAIKHYRQALKKIPRDPLIMNNLIVVYRLAKKYKDAEKTGYRLLARASNNVEAYKNMTLVYYDQKKYEMAELLCINAGKMLEKKRKEDSTVKEDAGIYNNLGMIYMQMGNSRKALSQFDKALKVDPNSKDALINIGAISHRYRDYQRAIAMYSKVLKIEPMNSVAKAGLAYAFYGDGKAKEALAEFNQLLETKPDNLEAIFITGEIYYKFLRDFKNAVKYYKEYKKGKGSKLGKEHEVHNRLTTATAKLEMSQQMLKDEEEQKKKEELERKKALDKTKQEEAAQKKEGEAKLEGILKEEEAKEAAKEEEAKEEVKEEPAKEAKENKKPESGTSAK
jgi:tetratricopeptide (TPR) repeat protein